MCGVCITSLSVGNVWGVYHLSSVGNVWGVYHLSEPGQCVGCVSPL